MTKISQYPTISEPQLDDLLIGTDKNNSDETKNFSIQSIVDLVPGVVAPAYKSYVALINQEGTNAPVATILYNDLGGDVTWVRNFSGTYTGTLPEGLVTLNKQVVFSSSYASNTNPTKYFISVFNNDIDSQIIITTTNDSGLSDIGIGSLPIEIRVYN